MLNYDIEKEVLFYDLFQAARASGEYVSVDRYKIVLKLNDEVSLNISIFMTMENKDIDGELTIILSADNQPELRLFQNKKFKDIHAWLTIISYDRDNELWEMIKPVLKDYIASKKDYSTIQLLSIYKNKLNRN